MGNKTDRQVSQPVRFVYWGMVIVLLVPVTFLALGRTLNLYDEAIITVGATRVSEGAFPNRDFYTQYGPASFYLNAFAFWLFGTSLVVERFVDATVRVLIALAVYSSVRLLTSFRQAAAAAVTVWIWVVGVGFSAYPIFPCILLAMCCVRVILPVFMNPKRPISSGRFFGLGLLVGLTALFRYDVGFLLGLGIVPFFFFVFMVSATDRRSRIKGMLIFLSGGIIIAGPWFIALVSMGAARGFWHDVVQFSTGYYRAMRGLPFPPVDLSYSGVIMVAGVYLAPILWLVEMVTIARLASRDRWAVFLLTALSMAFFMKGLVRVSQIHLVLSTIPAIVSLWIGGSHAGVRQLRGPFLSCWFVIQRIARASAFVALFIGTVFPGYMLVTNMNGWLEPVDQEVGWVKGIARRCRPPAEISRAACFSLPPDMEASIKFVVHHTRDDEPIFVGAGRHDKIFVNNIAFYFFAERRPATHWYPFDPGLQTRADIQREIVSELERTRTRVVVLDSTWDDAQEPNGSAHSSGVTILDEFLARQSREIVRYGAISIREIRWP